MGRHGCRLTRPFQVTLSDSLFETLRERFATEIRQLGKRDRPSTTNPVIYDLRGAAIANLAHQVHGNQIAQPEELP